MASKEGEKKPKQTKLSDLFKKLGAKPVPAGQPAPPLPNTQLGGPAGEAKRQRGQAEEAGKAGAQRCKQQSE
jgi:hypothetical protein